MINNWPEGIEAFEEFLQSKGLTFQRRGIVPHTGDKLWQYGTDKIAVRVIADRGDVWSAQVADIAGWPQEWYAGAELREFIKGGGEDLVHGDGESVAYEMRIIRDNWPEIVDAFSPKNRGKTHTLLKRVRIERAKRRYGL